jgi:hypothetical protein
VQVRVTIDCTPAEARAFFGLPDLTPLHGSYLEQMDKLIKEGMSPSDFERIMRTWLPGIGDNWEQWQRAFWAASTGANKSG